MFGGGGWIFFRKTAEKGDVYNDYNSNLTNLFTSIKTRPLALLKELGYLPLNSRDEFFALRRFINKEPFLEDDPFLQEELELAERHLDPPDADELKSIYRQNAADDSIRRAAAFFKLIRYSYGSSTTTFGCAGVNIRKFFALIWMASYRMLDAVVENKDFEALIHHYDRPDVFFYCDPPYVEAEDYDVDFTPEDHVRLRDTLLGIQGHWLLSYNDHPTVRALYEQDGIFIETIERLDNIALRHKPGQVYKELLISNYDTSARQELPEQTSLFVNHQEANEI